MKPALGVLFTIASLAVAPLAFAEGLISANGTRGKLIEFSHPPFPSEIRRNAAEFDRLPFDGVVLDLPLDRTQPETPENRWAWHQFGRETYTVERFAQEIEDLKAAKLERLTHNFLRVNVAPGDVDWFEDFAPILNNLEVAATVANRAGLKGICFDVETYQGRVWSYPKQKLAKEKSFVEYHNQVRERGRECMRALNRGFPDIEILVLPWTYESLWGAAEKAGETATVDPAAPSAAVIEHLAPQGYGLLPAFIYGMLETAERDTVLIDGWERGYRYNDEAPFRAARERLLRHYLRFTPSPQTQARQFQLAFGIWVDRNSQSFVDGWSAQEPSKNPITPRHLEQLVRSAMKHSDGYVWIYSEHLDWWRGFNVHPDYVEALRRARGEN